MQWVSILYMLQDDLVLEEYNPMVILKAGELVCDGEYMNPVPRTKLWYTIPSMPIRTKVKMKHVVKAACTMHPSSEEHKMPHNCKRTPLGALKLDPKDDKFMLEKYIIVKCWNMRNVVLSMK